jgi:hypothetical protein
MTAAGQRSGADLLRLVVRNMDGNSEAFNQMFTAAELLQIFTMQLASAWDFSPDEWTTRQVREALAGKPPRWDDQERPLYDE